jgi:hypothetical protein
MPILLLISGMLAHMLAFTIQASVEGSMSLSLPSGVVRAYFSDLSVFKRHFPGIVEAKRISPTESLWTYEMDAPLSPKKRTTFRLVQQEGQEGAVEFRTAEDAGDFMLCRASVVAAGETETRVTIGLQLRMTRESGGDFHFMAPLLGQKFISNEMRKQVKDDLETFLARTRDELYRINKR